MFTIWTLTPIFSCFQYNETKSRTICCNVMKTLSIIDVNKHNHKMHYQCASSTIMNKSLLLP
jgi:hypothetical protein